MKKMLQDAQPGKDTIKDFLMLLRSLTLDKGHNCPMFSPFASTSSLYPQHHVLLQGQARVTGHLFAWMYKVRFLEGVTMSRKEIRKALAVTGECLICG
jgi:hypothetical protein